MIQFRKSFIALAMAVAVSSPLAAQRPRTPITVQWLGHAAFEITSSCGTRILIDPFLTGNPATPDSLKKIERYKPAAILVSHAHPQDDLEPQDPPRATRTHSAALQFLCGYDPRTLEQIANEVPCSKQRLGFLVCQIADRLGISTTAPGRRKRKAAQPCGGTARVSRLQKTGEVNGPAKEPNL